MGDATDLVGFEGDFDDMINLPELNENGILINLKRRYMTEKIYTYTGTILVACNPYKWIGLYEDNHVKQYSEARFGDMPPHIFAIAQAAYHAMKQNDNNQSVIISGESGAGKTESTKLILQFLTAITSNQAWVEQQIMEANTILESFGNAKTVRNNNSSRFGKFMQVHFNKSRHIMGASIVNYLLEKSRVVKQAKDERNYHCFYQLCFGATPDEKTKYKLKNPEQFAYLNQSGCTTIPSVNDAKDYEALKLAFTVMNMSPEEIDSVFRVLSSILHLGDVIFNADDGGDKVTIADMGPVQILSELLEVDLEKLKEALTHTEVVVRGESTKIPLKSDQAVDNRDAVSKVLYSRLFDYLVDYINQSIRPKEKSNTFIGVLDIFGFELFENNSFEQFCINFANEKLQQFFTNYIFKLEQAEYDKEGINWSQISFSDNAPCIEMIEGKASGILAILDEESRFPKATDQTFLAKMEDKYAKNEHYVKPTKLRDMFGIKHYAGEVLYSVHNFLDKNKDDASTLILRLLESAKVKLVSTLATFDANRGGEDESAKDKGKTMKKKATVGGFFKVQLTELVTVLGSTEPQYVRCVKPNPDKLPFKFDEELVVAQLRYSGMLETIRIRKAGYNVRVPFETFYSKFKCLVPNKSALGGDPKAATKQILTDLNIDASEWQLGKTKVFLRNSVFIPLQDALDAFIDKMATRVAKVIKGNYYRRRYMRMKSSSVIVQKNIRMFLCRTQYLRTAKAVVKIQSVVRGWFARDFYRALKEEKRRMEEELRKKREEEERKRREEEEARISAEAAAAAEKERAAKEKADEEDRKKRQREEEEIMKLTREAQQAKMKMAQGEQLDIKALGDMFSFLDVVDNEIVDKESLNANLSQMMNSLNNQLDELYETEADDYKKTIKKKSASSKPAPTTSTPAGSTAAPTEEIKSAEIYERVQKRSAYRTVRGGPAAMKSNPLMKQMGDDAKKTAAEEEQFDDSLEAYGNKHFDEHEKSQGTMGTLRKKKKLTVQEMWQYIKSPIPTSMLKYNDARREKMVQVAIEIFKQINKILESDNKDTSTYPIIQNIIKLGIGVVELRDEILVQIVRQTGEPAKRPKYWDSTCHKAWILLLITLSTFPPSKNFSRYLKKHLHKCQEIDETVLAKEFAERSEKKFDDDPEAPKTLGEYIETKKKIAAVAKSCEEAMHSSVLNGARKLPPSAVEIEANRAGRPIICRFYFLDGVTKAIHIKSSTSAAQALKELAEKIDLPETTGWSIYEVVDLGNGKEEEAVVKANSNIADILARWEIERTLVETKYQTVKKGAAPVEAVGAGDAKFVVKRRLFRTPQKIPTDPVEYHLIYAQAVHGVLRGDYPINEAAVTRLAALKAQVVWGDYDPKQTSRYNEIQQYIPLRYLETKSKEDWIKEIGAIHEKLKGKSELQAKVLYLEAVKQFPMYGAALFSAVYKGFWAYSNNLMIAVHVNGLAWVHPKTKAIMKSFPYSRLQNWELDNGVVIFNFHADPNVEQEELLRYEFECKYNEEVVNLIKDYSPNHRSGITQADQEAKRRQELDISEEQLGSLGAEIDRCREKLLDIKLLRTPGPSTLSGSSGSMSSWTFTTKKKLTLKKDGKGTLKKAKEQDALEAYTIGDWSFSKNRLSFSLMDFDLTTDAELNENAIKINGYIASFATIIPMVPTLEDKTLALPAAPLVQEIVRLAIESPQLRDELYLQLIKQTTNHPEPDSKVVLKIWRLLAIVTWVVLPSIHVLAYLRAHLRAIAYSNAPGLYRRAQEREFAKYCLKAVQRTYTTGPRKQPPTVQEILSVMNQKPIFSRFYFMDGQFRALTFDPATITSEVLDMVKEKIGVKNCTGFALFESFGSLERAMTGKEKIADTVYKWDKFAKQTNSDKQLRLVFKRRIFMAPLDKFSNDIERDLVMHQAINDITNDRFPVTEEEVAYLSGLRAQIELGDLPSYSPDNTAYTDNIKKYFPKHLVKSTAVALVASAHEKLKGKTAEECKKMYMDHICTWEYYGDTIYNVLQSYTSAMPNNLWLLVGHQGVHILNRRSKTPLLSFPYKSIVNYSPSHKNIMIMTESLTRGTKYVFNTSEASQIAHLIKDYTETIMQSRKKEGAVEKSGKTALPKK